MKFVCPLIVVKDIARSRAFYENVMGAKVRWDFGENVAFEGDFAIHLQEHYVNLMENNDFTVTHKSNSMELYFESDDMNAEYERIKAAKVEFVHELREQPWGQRVFRFYDPDNHIIEIGENMQAVVIRFLKEGMTCEQVADKTSMPLDFVRSIEL